MTVVNPFDPEAGRSWQDGGVIDYHVHLWERPRGGAMAAATDRIVEMESGGDIDAYAEVILAAQDEGLPIELGMEVDYLPGTVEAMGGVLADYPFDVLLGSVHWLDSWLFDALEIPEFGLEWARRDPAEVWNSYVDHVLELAGSGMVDVMAHLDLIKIAGRWPDGVEQIENRLVDGLADCGTAIEYSTSGLDRPFREMYPSPGIMDRVLRAGLPLTMASDAHDPHGVGRGFDAFRSDFACRGVDSVQSFHRRRPSPYGFGPLKNCDLGHGGDGGDRASAEHQCS